MPNPQPAPPLPADALRIRPADVQAARALWQAYAGALRDLLEAQPIKRGEQA